MDPYGEHMSGWGYALGIIGMVLFWAVLVLAIAAAVHNLDRKRRESFPPPAPARADEHPGTRSSSPGHRPSEKSSHYGLFGKNSGFFASGGHGACSGR